MLVIVTRAGSPPPAGAAGDFDFCVLGPFAYPPLLASLPQPPSRSAPAATRPAIRIGVMALLLPASAQVQRRGRVIGERAALQHLDRAGRHEPAHEEVVDVAARH